jgi:hypothetical protein
LSTSSLSLAPFAYEWLDPFLASLGRPWQKRLDRLFACELRIGFQREIHHRLNALRGSGK